LLWAGAVAVLPIGATCPSANAIAAELDRLGASAALAALGSPEVTVTDTKMQVVLRGQDGSRLGAREIAAPEACNERATVAAVFIAAWVGEWNTAPLAEKQNSKLEAPSHDAAPASSSAVRAETRLKPESRVEIAGLGFGTHDGDAGTYGAGLLVGYRPRGALALAALFEGTGQRERTLGPGLAGYRTFRLGVGAGVLRKWGRVFGDVGIFPELTLLTLNGKRLQSGRAATVWGAAADLRARLGFNWGRVAPFLFTGGSYALRGERLTLDDRQQNVTLSRWNFSVGAGLAFLFGEK
jgi:hypothetical protein